MYIAFKIWFPRQHQIIKAGVRAGGVSDKVHDMQYISWNNSNITPPYKSDLNATLALST